MKWLVREAGGHEIHELTKFTKWTKCTKDEIELAPDFDEFIASLIAHRVAFLNWAWLLDSWFVRPLGTKHTKDAKVSKLATHPKSLTLTAVKRSLSFGPIDAISLATGRLVIRARS